MTKGSSASQQLTLAKRHLERVQGAWDDPTDWTALCLFGFYCLEAAVAAAATHLEWPMKRTHPGKMAAAERLAAEEGLPGVSQLLQQLNEARKSEAYGDISRPDLDPAEVASVLEGFVDAVEDLIAQ